MADDVQITAGSGTTIATDDVGSGRQVQLIKPVYGGDGSATMVAADAGLPTAVGSMILSGSASANNTELIASTDVSGYQMFSYVMTGTFAAGCSVEGSNDNSTWVAVPTLNTAASSGASNLATSAQTVAGVAIVGWIPTRYIRLRTSSYTSGTVTATMRVFNGSQAMLYGNSVTTSLAAGGALADAASVLSAGNLRAVPAAFNGSTYDRWRGNLNATTGDSGAKTANFLGATQTNYNARGAYITLVLGTVTGSITTFQTALQWSYDGGTTWLPLTALGANLTTPASGDKIVWHIYPGISSQTPAASAGVAAATQYNYADAALPRTWRFAMDVAGTTPSITIASVNVNYIV